MRIQLSPADRERLGAPEWLDFDMGNMSNREAIVLQRDAGYADPFGDLRAAWYAQLDEGEDGATKVVRVDFTAWTAVVWLALHRAGIKVDFDDLEFDVMAISTKPGKADDEGKDEAPSTSAT